MKKRFLVLNFLLFIVCSFNVLAINFPEKANKVEDFIPKGWKSIVIKKTVSKIGLLFFNIKL